MLWKPANANVIQEEEEDGRVVRTHSHLPLLDIKPTVLLLLLRTIVHNNNNDDNDDNNNNKSNILLEKTIRRSVYSREDPIHSYHHRHWRTRRMTQQLLLLLLQRQIPLILPFDHLRLRRLEHGNRYPRSKIIRRSLPLPQLFRRISNTERFYQIRPRIMIVAFTAILTVCWSILRPVFRPSVPHRRDNWTSSRCGVKLPNRGQHFSENCRGQLMDLNYGMPFNI